MVRATEISPRPPIEANSLQLELATGCPQGKRCKFCNLYTNGFKPASREQIMADIREVADLWFMRPRRVFLQSGDPFSVPHDLLVFTLEAIRDYLPEVESVGGFCRVATVKRTADEELADWARLGVANLAIGAESGDDEALAGANKQHTAADIIEQCARLDAHGITYTLFYMPGLAGAGNGQRNALASAAVYSQTRPLYINCITTTIGDDSEFGREVAAGAFTRASDRECVEEIRTFISKLTCPTTFDCMNELNAVKFMVPLPLGRDSIVEQLDGALEPQHAAYLDSFNEQRQRITSGYYPERQ